MIDLKETKHESYAALAVAVMLANQLPSVTETWRFLACLGGAVILTLFAGTMRLLIKRWQLDDAVLMAGRSVDDHRGGAVEARRDLQSSGGLRTKNVSV